MNIEFLELLGVRKLNLSRGTLRLSCECDVREVRLWGDGIPLSHEAYFCQKQFDCFCGVGTAFLVFPFMLYDNSVNRRSCFSKLIGRYFDIDEFEVIDEYIFSVDGWLIFVAKCRFDSSACIDVLKFFVLGGQGLVFIGDGEFLELAQFEVGKGRSTALVFSLADRLIDLGFEVLLFDFFVETKGFSAFRLKRSEAVL